MVARRISENCIRIQFEVNENWDVYFFHPLHYIMACPVELESLKSTSPYFDLKFKEVEKYLEPFTLQGYTIERGNLLGNMIIEMEGN